MSTDLPSRQSLRDRQGDVRSYISPSRLNLWLKCPLAWKLRYVDGIKTPTTANLFVGKMCHSGLERFYRHRQLGITLEPADVGRQIVEAWDSAVEEERMEFKSAIEERDLKYQAIDLVEKYVARVPADEPRPLAVEAVMEVPLVDPVGGEDLGIPLVGIVDLILDGREGPVITDFKTAARSSPPLEISHEIQLTSYAFLFRHVSDRQEASLEIRQLIKTKTPKIEFHRYAARTESHFRRLFAVVREYLDALDRGRFNFRPGWGCGMCDFKGGPCRAWQG